MNIRLIMAYDGGAYHGWQRQKNALAVQEVMEGVIDKIAKRRSEVTGCSRTDAGVHARMYVCNFKGETSVPLEKLPLVLNSLLPEDIRVKSCEKAADNFNSRFDAESKIYEYKILNTPHNDPFLRRYAWHYPIALDVARMREAAAMIRGKRDFTAFMAAGSKAKSAVRNLFELSVEKEDGIITVRAGADGFLYNMVRIITGTLVYAGNKKLTAEDIGRILEKGDRTLAGLTAPPQGLALAEVRYRS